MDEENPSAVSAKRKKVSVGEALAKQHEFNSASSAAYWVIEEFENDFESSDEPLETRVPKILKRLKNRIERLDERRKKSKKPLPEEVLMQPALTNSMVDILEVGKEKCDSPPQSSTTPSKTGRPPKSIDDVKLSGQRKKLQPIIASLNKAGQDLGGKTPTELCGRILQELNYTSNRKLGLVGKAIYEGTFSDKTNQMEMCEAEALFMKTHELQLSDLQYTNLRLRLLRHGSSIPTLQKLKEFEKSQRYPIVPFLGGFRASLTEIAKKTLSQIVQIPEVAETIAKLDPEVSFPLKAQWLTGFDGSGSQPTAMQRSRNEASNNPTIPAISQQNRETVVAVLKDIKTKNGDVIFETEKIASTHSCRIYMLFPQKENRQVMEKFIPIMDAEEKELQDMQMDVSLPNGEVAPFENTVSMVLTDGKAAKEATGLGGAYCLLGTCSKEAGHDVERIQAGFDLNRTMAQVKEIFEKLYNEEIGGVAKANKDYDVRQGVTHRPLTSQSVNQAPRPLHCVLRLYNLFQRLLYKTLAKIKAALDPDLEIDEKKLLANCRLIVIEAMKKGTGIPMDTPTSKGGTTDTGNAAKRFFSEESIPVLRDLFPPEEGEAILELHHYFSVIVGILPSKRRVDTSKLKQLCTDAYLLLRSKFSYVPISETAHMVLGHSFQLIELNDGYGLGQMSEQGLEGLNKLVRRFSERYARQRSLDANITDVVNRLQVLSNPFLMTYRRKPQCTRCCSVGDHWTVSCPNKEKIPWCKNLKEQLRHDLHEEIETYLN